MSQVNNIPQFIEIEHDYGSLGMPTKQPYLAPIQQRPSNPAPTPPQQTPPQQTNKK